MKDAFEIIQILVAIGLVVVYVILMRQDALRSRNNNLTGKSGKPVKEPHPSQVKGA